MGCAAALKCSIRRWPDRPAACTGFTAGARQIAASRCSSAALRAEADGGRAPNAQAAAHPVGANLFARAVCLIHLITSSPHHLITAARQQVVSYRGAPRQCHLWRVGVLILAEGRGSWLADDGVRSGPEIQYSDGRTDPPRTGFTADARQIAAARCSSAPTPFGQKRMAAARAAAHPVGANLNWSSNSGHRLRCYAAFCSMAIGGR
jgi:hypothetical protein